MDNFDANAAKEKEKARFQEQITPARNEKDRSRIGMSSGSHLLQSDWRESQSEHQSRRHFVDSEDKKVAVDADPLTLSNAMPDQASKDQEEILQIIKRHEEDKNVVPQLQDELVAEKSMNSDNKQEIGRQKMNDQVALLKKIHRDAICKEQDEIDLQNDENERDDNLPERIRNNGLYRVCYMINSHFLFGTVIILLIVTNTVVLALDRYPIDQDEFETLGKDALITFQS